MKLSLKSKIIGITVGSALVLGLTSVILFKKIINATHERVMGDFASISEGLDLSIAAQFYERYGDVQTFALNPGLVSPDHNEVVGYLNSYAALYGIYDLIMAVDKSGTLVAVNDKAPDGKPINVEALYKENFSSTPWFKAAMAGQFTEDKTNGFSGTFVEQPHFDPWVSMVWGAKRFGNSFTTVVKNKAGHVIGVITNRAGSRWYENEFALLLQRMRENGYVDTEIQAITKDGLVFFDHKISPEQKTIEFSHDESILGKTNLTENLQAAKNLIEGKSGSEVFDINGEATAISYNTVNSNKFIPSLGWGVIVRLPVSEFMATLEKTEKVFYFSFAAVLLLAIIGGFLWSSSLGLQFRAAFKKLFDEAGNIDNTSGVLASLSHTLSESATEQAAALQETVSAIDEVSSMIAKNADNAKKSQEASTLNEKTAHSGKQAVEEVIVAIDEINKSNEEIMAQIETSNQEISEIVKVISEIGNKTKVINDIVFQTKLLSFNASVEAARAGEHGKGFAVVAEEVGNLAQMSGNAAKEISDMLSGSITKVESIVENTKSKVQRLVATGKEKVATGTVTAKKCGEVLDEIVKNVGDVKIMVDEISAASQEQSQGVQEITRAMNQLDQVTQRNAGSSQQASQSADHLKAEASSLTRVVSELIEMVEAKKVEMKTVQKHMATKVNEKKPGKILNFTKGGVTKHKEGGAQKGPSPANKAAETKKAVGHDVPLESDARFEDF